MTDDLLTFDDLYSMKIHETRNIDAHTSVMRVPGGLIYKTISLMEEQGLNISCVFVPLNVLVPESYE